MFVCTGKLRRIVGVEIIRAEAVGRRIRIVTATIANHVIE